MSDRLDSFLEILKLSVAPTTYTRKAWQIKSFCEYLRTSELDYYQVDKKLIEKYLLSLSVCRSVKQQRCFVIGEYFEFMKLDNPVKDIHFRKVKNRKLPKVPSQNMIENIIKNLDTKETVLSLRNRLIVELAYGSGLRRSELAKLDINDINFENRTIFITGKGDKDRVVPITQNALEVLRKYLNNRKVWHGALLVSFTEKRLSHNSIYGIFKEKIGINPHALRHACASHMLKNGCGIRVIQELLGHKKLSATQIYTVVNKNDLRDVINKKHPRNL